MQNLKIIQQAAETLARTAGAKLLDEYRHFNRLGIRYKTPRDIVTRADLISEEHIIGGIRKRFPAHSILSEESGQSPFKSDWLWVVDPLDGTTNFTFHNPLWAVSIGVAHLGEVVAAAVYAPIQDELFSAARGIGAFLNGRKTDVNAFKTKKAVHSFCHGSGDKNIRKAVRYYSKQKLSGFDCRQLGSASIELAYVSCGRLASIMIPGAHPWDVAAGALLVREAGGRVTDFAGRPWHLGSKDILATDGRRHREVLGMIVGR